MRASLPEDDKGRQFNEIVAGHDLFGLCSLMLADCPPQSDLAPPGGFRVQRNAPRSTRIYVREVPQFDS